MKKYYILALTFLCLLMGQVSYGQNLNEGENFDQSFTFECSNCGLEFREYIEGFTSFLVAEGLVQFDNPEISTSMDIENLIQTYQEVYNEGFDNEINNFEFSIYIDIVENNIDFVENNWEPDCPDPCPSGDYCDCYGIGCPEDEGPTEPNCNITSCTPGYNLLDCECVLDPCFNKDLRHKKVSDDEVI